MSTAGKVLVVLVLLVLPVWIILVSAVAQLNSEWSQELTKQQKQVETLTASVAKNEQAIRSLEDKISLEQLATREQENVLRAKLTEVERSRAEMIEVQTAVAVQVAILQQAVAKAEVARSSRDQEQKNEAAGLAAAQKSVEELKTANTQLMGELEQLRNEFRSLLESNKKLVERALQNTSRRAGTTRAASFVH